MSAHNNVPPTPLIAGDRLLSANEVAAINYVRHLGNEVGSTLLEMEKFPGIDKRWLAMARTDLQKGFMFAVRAIEKPEIF